jgi:hypothetical protein
VRRTWDVTHHPRWLVFEVEGRLQIRPLQYRIAQTLMDNPGAVVQLNMGEGKTRVILPMLALHWADGNHVVGVRVPGTATMRCACTRKPVDLVANCLFPVTVVTVRFAASTSYRACLMSSPRTPTTPAGGAQHPVHAAAGGLPPPPPPPHRQRPGHQAVPGTLQPGRAAGHSRGTGPLCHCGQVQASEGPLEPCKRTTPVTA